MMKRKAAKLFCSCFNNYSPILFFFLKIIFIVLHLHIAPGSPTEERV